MASKFNDPNAFVLPSKGFCAYAPVNTAPIDVKAFDVLDEKTYTGWTLVDTSAENPFKTTRDGGDLKTVRTAMDPNKRSKAEDATDGFEMGIVEWTENAIALAYPDGVAAAGTYSVKSSSATANHAFMFFAKENDTYIGIYYGNCTISAGDGMEIDYSGDQFVEMGIKGAANTDENGNAFVYLGSDIAAVTPTPPAGK